jgi:hypothetical protein
MPVKTCEWSMLCAFVLKKQRALLCPKFLQVPRKRRGGHYKQHDYNLLHSPRIKDMYTIGVNNPLTCNVAVFQFGLLSLKPRLPTAFCLSIKMLARSTYCALSKTASDSLIWDTWTICTAVSGGHLCFDTQIHVFLLRTLTEIRGVPRG